MRTNGNRIMKNVDSPSSNKKVTFLILLYKPLMKYLITILPLSTVLFSFSIISETMIYAAVVVLGIVTVKRLYSIVSG